LSFANINRPKQQKLSCRKTIFYIYQIVVVFSNPSGRRLCYHSNQKMQVC